MCFIHFVALCAGMPGGGDHFLKTNEKTVKDKCCSNIGNVIYGTLMSVSFAKGKFGEENSKGRSGKVRYRNASAKVSRASVS